MKNKILASIFAIITVVTCRIRHHFCAIQRYCFDPPLRFEPLGS